MDDISDRIIGYAALKAKLNNRKEFLMVETQNMVECMLFCVNAEKPENAGLGVHSFARIPCRGELISLEDQTEADDKDNVVMYEVNDVVHTGYGDHKAELLVIRKKFNRWQYHQ